MKMCNLIGPQVRKLREEKGWTQRTLSEKLQVAGLDISRSSLAKVESRLIKVSDNELFYFARVFNVSLCRLFPSMVLRELVGSIFWPNSRRPVSREA